MLALKWLPPEDRSQESDIGEKHGSEIETSGLVHLLDGGGQIDNCDNSLWPLDPFLEHETMAEVLDFGDQDQNGCDNFRGYKSDEEVLAVGTEHAPSGGILDEMVETVSSTVSGILGGPEESAPQAVDSDGNSMQLLSCFDQSNEVGTYMRGKPVVTVWSRGP